MSQSQVLLLKHIAQDICGSEAWLQSASQFDPEIKPVMDPLLQSRANLLEAITSRGVEYTKRKDRPMEDKETYTRWVGYFSDTDFAEARKHEAQNLLTWAQKSDRALVPTLNAYFETREAVATYLRTRTEPQS